MKASATLKSLVAALTLGSFAFIGSAEAYDDDDDKRDVVIGIIGEVIAGAAEAQRANDEDAAYERRCARWQHRCEEGSDWACEKYERNCAGG